MSERALWEPINGISLCRCSVWPNGSLLHDSVTYDTGLSPRSEDVEIDWNHLRSRRGGDYRVAPAMIRNNIDLLSPQSVTMCAEGALSALLESYESTSRYDFFAYS